MNFIPLASSSRGNEEEWKDIPGFEGVYQISNLGRLKSFKYLSEGRVLSNKNKRGGYFSVILCHGEKRRFCRLHVLVAEAFVSNPENKPEVNHKDHNKQNTRADNLEWATRIENHMDAVKNIPSMLSGIHHYNKFVRTRPIQKVSLDGLLIAEFTNGAEAAKATGICQRNILQVANRTEYKPGLTRRQAGGFIWRFKDGVQTNSKL